MKRLYVKQCEVILEDDRLQFTPTEGDNPRSVIVDMKNNTIDYHEAEDVIAVLSCLSGMSKEAKRAEWIGRNTNEVIEFFRKLSHFYHIYHDIQYGNNVAGRVQ